MFDEIRVIQSAETSVKKLVLTKADAVAETVLYRYPTYQDRTVICCSSQSGCPVGVNRLRGLPSRRSAAET